MHEFIQLLVSIGCLVGLPVLVSWLFEYRRVVRAQAFDALCWELHGWSEQDREAFFERNAALLAELPGGSAQRIAEMNVTAVNSVRRHTRPLPNSSAKPAEAGFESVAGTATVSGRNMASKAASCCPPESDDSEPVSPLAEMHERLLADLRGNGFSVNPMPASTMLTATFPSRPRTSLGDSQSGKST